MTEAEYHSAVREPSDESKRWCVNCHARVEFSEHPLAIGNMLRHVAGLPPEAAGGDPDA